MAGGLVAQTSPTTAGETYATATITFVLQTDSTVLSPADHSV